MTLFRGRRVLTAAELAATLEVCERTIYRDIAHLQASGVGIEGAGGVGYIADENLQLPPLNFTLDQLEALSLGASFVVEAADPDLAQSALDALDKIAAVLPATSRDGQRGAVIVASRRSSTRAPLHAAKLRSAIRNRVIVEFDYESPAAVRTHRRLRPVLMTAFNDSWTVTGWCELRAEIRNFRIDRMNGLAATAEHFEEIDGRSVELFLQRRAARDNANRPPH